MEAYVMINVGGHKVYPQNVYKEKLGQIEGIEEVHIVFGRYDLIAKIKAKDLDDLINIVDTKMRDIPGVQTTETFIAY